MIKMIIMSVGVSGGEKLQTRAKINNPMKLSGGPGRTGRILPTNPRRTKMAPITKPI